MWNNPHPAGPGTEPKTPPCKDRLYPSANFPPCQGTLLGEKCLLLGDITISFQSEY